LISFDEKKKRRRNDPITHSSYNQITRKRRAIIPNIANIYIHIASRSASRSGRGLKLGYGAFGEAWNTTKVHALSLFLPLVLDVYDRLEFFFVFFQELPRP
jgi:hypothetical protein